MMTWAWERLFRFGNEMLRFLSFYKVLLDFGFQHAVTNKIRDNRKKKSQLPVTTTCTEANVNTYVGQNVGLREG